MVIGYFIGSINPAYFFGRLKKFDIREKGDGIAGTVNTYHNLGLKFAIPTAIFDTLKGVFVIFIALSMGADFIFAQLSGLAAIAGHVFPFYIKFRGGQGMACTSGILLAYLLNYILVGPEMLIFLFCYLIFIIAIFVYVTRTGVVIALIVLALLGYTAFIYYPESPYNIFFWIVIAYDMSFTFYDMIKGKIIKIEDETFKSEWWRMVLRLLSLFFLVFYEFFSQSIALLIISIFLAFFILLDLYRIFFKKITGNNRTEVKSIFRKKEYQKFSSISIYLVAFFITILVYPKNIAITATTFLIFGDISSKIFGLGFGRHKILNKTIEGTLAFFGSMLVCGYFLYPLLGISLVVLVLGMIAAPIVELLSLEMDDNFTVPIISAAVMYATYLAGF
jgi:glycerol-3-phosphate acyltransferase PlsY